MCMDLLLPKASRVKLSNENILDPVCKMVYGCHCGVDLSRNYGVYPKKLVELWRSEPLGKFMQERIKDLRERIVRSKTN